MSINKLKKAIEKSADEAEFAVDQIDMTELRKLVNDQGYQDVMLLSHSPEESYLILIQKVG
jgi:hypothetical protein